MKTPVVLVTGATSGIGEAIARKLPDKGYVPILLGRRSSRLKEIHRELNRGSYYSCDITKEAEVKQVVEEIIQTYGRIDVLINNAGYGCFGGFLDVSPDDYRGMMETNYLGAVRMVRHVLPHMLRAGQGRIINIASLSRIDRHSKPGRILCKQICLDRLFRSSEIGVRTGDSGGGSLPWTGHDAFFQGRRSPPPFPP